MYNYIGGGTGILKGTDMNHNHPGYNDLYNALSAVLSEDVDGDTQKIANTEPINVTPNLNDNKYQTAQVALIPKTTSGVSPDGGNANAGYFWTSDGGEQWRYAKNIVGNTFYEDCKKFDVSDDFKKAFKSYLCWDSEKKVHTYVSYYFMIRE